MMILKRLLNVLALFIGFLGLVGCIAAIVGVWIGSARLSRTTENLFGEIDKSFVVVRDRFLRTLERVQESEITTGSLEQSLRDWSKKEVSQRLASQFNVEEKAERLASILGQADHWLELSASSTEIVRMALSMESAAGAPTNTELADRLLEEIGSLRNHLAQASELVEKIGEHTAHDIGEKTLEERIDQALQWAMRLLATLGSIESRLTKLESNVYEIQEKVRQWKNATVQWILIATIGISLLLVWMAAGQFFLCFHGWKGLRQGRILQQHHSIEMVRPQHFS